MPETEELEWIILLNKILGKGNPRYSRGMETVIREASSLSLSHTHTHTPLNQGEKQFGQDDGKEKKERILEGRLWDAAKRDTAQSQK